MAGFMTKKKKYLFSVILNLEGLSSVPFINGQLYAKVRLRSGGNFEKCSPRYVAFVHSIWSHVLIFLISSLLSFYFLNLLCILNVNSGYSTEVQEHSVKWETKFEFTCRMSADASSGVLNSCYLRISVRKVSILMKPLTVDFLP